MELIKKLTSEPTIYVFTGLFLLFMILTASENFSTKLASVYGTMIGIDFTISRLISTKININPIGGNTLQSIAYAIGAIFILTLIYQILNYVARTSTIVSPVTESAFARNLAQIKQQAVLFSIEFEKIPFLSFILFVIVIPLIETRLLARLFDFFTQTFQIAYNRFSVGLLALIIFLSAIFTQFHFKVRGINNNIDLALTFIFAVISILLFIKFKEAESATEFHIGWNGISMLRG